MEPDGIASTPKPVEKAKKMPSPTVNTKLANEEIMAMFDQTIHGKGRRRNDEDDDSDTESDESGDEGEDVQSAPTPLPSRAGPSMMAPEGYFVPPTPTPAQGHLAQHRTQAPVVFSDENAVPSSASKPARFNVFSETSAKTPLAARTPLASSASRPRAFEAFDEGAENNENAAPSSSRQVNIFATPAVKGPAKRGVFSNAIVEEEDEEGPADGPLDHVIENPDEYVASAGEYNQGQGQWRHISGAFDIMTPITERTQEFTQMTNLRSSQSTNIFSNASSGRRSSVRSVFQDENDVPEGTAPALDVVKEEDEERSGSRRTRTSTPDDSMVFNPSDASGPNLEASGAAPEGFALPEGYTIHNRPQNDMMQHTMVLSDRQQDTTNTMHTAKEASPEPESNDTDAFVTANHGQEDAKPFDTTVELPNPCIPTDEEVVAKLLSIAQPPLARLPNFHDLRQTTSNRLTSLHAHTKAKARRSSTAPRQSVSSDDNVAITLGDREFEVTDKIGEGGFGAVFLAVDIRLREQIEDADSDDEDDDNDDELDRSLVAIKVEKPGAVWEAVILDRILSRLDPTSIASIIRPRDLFAFADESYLVLDFASQGTLLDAVNKASSMGIAPATAGGPSALDELVAIFFTIELLRLVETLHRSNFIHGDLKIDNCLVRLEAIPTSQGGASSWTPQYSRSGENGWRHKGVKLIDFGRAIDLSLFPAGQRQRFKADWKIDERDCNEMREDRDWSFETDYFGLASICHCMLFGKYISTEKGAAPEGKRGPWYKITTPLKRVSLPIPTVVERLSRC